MDMKISGSGQIPGGEYEVIRISGSGRIAGPIRCDSLHVSGSMHAEDGIECKNEFKISGSGRVGKAVKSGSMSVSGSGHTGSLHVDTDLRASGSLHAEGSVKAGSIHISGSIKADGDVEAEEIHVSGIANCKGLMNAENIEIEFQRGMEIDSIGGSTIRIYRRLLENPKSILPLFSSLVKRNWGFVTTNTVEGDVIALDGVKAQRVSGRIVAIGADCQIDLVQYSETVEIDPSAKVGRTEKI
ncbi:MAG: hypothetical protein IKZ21_04685 [Clostridia bacterium]|nr:hypothetical protein [Clostridia bacterium]